MTTITDLKDSASDFVGSDDFKKILPYLISGGASAAVGGLLSGRRRKKSGEGRLGYLGRILRNATIAGALGAGGHYLLGKGLDKTIGAIDAEQGLSGEGGDAGPLATTLKNIAFSPVTAAGAGGAALVATDKNGIIGAGRADRASKLSSLVKQLSERGHKGLDADVLRSKTPAEIAQLVPDELEATRRAAGLPSSKLGNSFVGKLPGLGVEKAEKLKGFISAQGRTGLLSTFGQSHPRRAGRGAIGLAAAGIPALAGAFLTD